MKRILLLAALCLFSVPAKAATVYFDLNTATERSVFPPTCNCPVSSGPIFGPMIFNPGDVVDFGSVEIFPMFLIRDWAIAGEPVNDGAFYIISYPTVRFDDSDLFFANSIVDPSKTSQVYDLEFTIGDSGMIKIGWVGPYIYTPPVELLTAAVPEPSTWVLMLLGFALVGYAGKRRYTVVSLERC